MTPALNIVLLIPFLIAVESAGNKASLGDNGASYGLLQIQRAVVEDVNRIYGTSYAHLDAFTPTLAKEICELYLEHYIAKERTGVEPTYENAARVWNGGPGGWTKKSTDKYWLKVRIEMNKEGFKYE